MRGGANLSSTLPFSLTHLCSIQSCIQPFTYPLSHFLTLSFCLSPQRLKAGPEVKDLSHLTCCMQLNWQCSLVVFLVSFCSAAGPRGLLPRGKEGVWALRWNDGWHWEWQWQEGWGDTTGVRGEGLFLSSFPSLRALGHPFSLREGFWALCVWQTLK